MLFDLRYNYILDQAQTFNIDFRAYRELTRRSLLAFRTIADYSDGDAPTLFSLGGNNNLRGDYRYSEFVGSKRVLSQVELRFPLVDQLRFPGFGFSNIRGSLFVEVGGAWFDSDDFNFSFQSSEYFDPKGYDRLRQNDVAFLQDGPAGAGYYQLALNPDSGLLEIVPFTTKGLNDPDGLYDDYLLGSYGAEISMVLMGLEVHWTWAKRTNFSEFPEGSRFSFWIGRKF